jgi:hypothetical protein
VGVKESNGGITGFVTVGAGEGVGAGVGVGVYDSSSFRIFVRFSRSYAAFSASVILGDVINTSPIELSIGAFNMSLMA